MATAATQSQNPTSWEAVLKDFFEVIEDMGKNVKVKCKQCLPAVKILSAAKSTPSNLYKHVEVITQLYF